jgi:hypothetical protein
MTSHLHLRIIDNPLVDNKTWRTRTLELMVAILIRDGTAGDEADAIRSLRPYFDLVEIIMCIDDARQAAFSQTTDIVAREMAQP